MIIQIFVTIFLMLGFGCILAGVEYLHRVYVVDDFYTRKIAHSLSSFASLIFLQDSIPENSIIFIALFFSLLLFIGKMKGLFQSIDSLHSKSTGSYLLPVAILVVCYFSRMFNNKLLLILPVLILAISDPLAGWTGTYFKDRTKRIIIFNRQLQKTVIGSIAFFISSLIISLITLTFFELNPGRIILLSLLISSTSTFIELISPYGTDNLSVPVITLVLLILNSVYS